MTRLENPIHATRGERILVIDTDPGVRWALERGLSRSGYAVRCVSNVAEALTLSEEPPFASVILEILPDAGLTPDALELLRDLPGAPSIICDSVDTDPRIVIDCMRRGAADFLSKPFGLADLRASLCRVLTRVEPAPPLERSSGAAPHHATESLLIGISPAMQELRTTIIQVAKTDLNCLLRGESGTGKDMAAREIHRLSIRADKPFVKVNCTALPEQLLESELFGYEKGAFTGAVTSKPGRFELAHRGVIFLDEIGDLHPSLQAKLLQVIEHKEFTKLGGRRHINVDVQIIAATNVDLEAHTRKGLFRDDLYFRLNEVCIWVPALAERKEDIPLLVRHFVHKHGRFFKGPPLDITAEDLNRLTLREWPGNVRELESTIKRWFALGSKALPATRNTAVGVPKGPAYQLQQLGAAGEPTHRADSTTEGEALRKTLERHQWNRRKAAEELGVSYQTLRRRIKRFGLDNRES